MGITEATDPVKGNGLVTCVATHSLMQGATEHSLQKRKEGTDDSLPWTMMRRPKARPIAQLVLDHLPGMA